MPTLESVEVQCLEARTQIKDSQDSHRIPVKAQGSQPIPLHPVDSHRIRAKALDSRRIRSLQVASHHTRARGQGSRPIQSRQEDHLQVPVKALGFPLHRFISQSRRRRIQA